MRVLGAMLELFRFARTSCKAYEVRPSTRTQQFFLIHENFHPFPSPIFFPSPPEKNFVPSSFCVFLLVHKDIFNLKMFLINKYFPPFSSPSFLSSAKKDIFLLQIFSFVLSPFFIIFSLFKYFLLFPSILFLSNLQNIRSMDQKQGSTSAW